MSLKRDIIVNITGAVLSRLLFLLAVPMVARSFPPEVFGYWPIILAVATVLVPLALLRYDIAVPLEADDDKARALMLAMTLVTAVLTVSLALACLFAPKLVLFGGTAQLPAYARAAAPIYLFATSLTAIASAWLVRQRLYLSLSLANTTIGATTLAGASIFPGLMGASVDTLLAIFVLGALVGMSVAVGAAVRHGALRNLTSAFANLLAAAKLHKVYPIYSTPYSLSAVALDRGIQVIISAAYGLGPLGLFYLTRQLLFLPVNVCTTALRQVVFGHAASSSDAEHRKQIISSVAGPVFMVVPLATGLSAYLIHHPIRVLLGTDWNSVAELLPPMVLHAGTLFITAWLDRVFDLFGRQRLSVVLQIVSDLGQLGLAFVAAVFEIPFLAFVWMISAFAGAYNLIWLVIVLRLAGFDRFISTAWLGGIIGFALIGLVVGANLAKIT